MSKETKEQKYLRERDELQREVRRLKAEAMDDREAIAMLEQRLREKADLLRKINELSSEA